MEFFKVHSTGNDFILIDDWALRFPQDAQWVARLCERCMGIGADGLILLQPSSQADVKMVYFNQDGQRADFCGNGLRAAAHLAHRLGHAPIHFKIESGAGVHEVEVEGRFVTASLPTPKEMRLNLSTEVEERRLNLHAIHTGVPHAVCFVPEIENFDVTRWGQAIRSHIRFGAEGINANFARMTADGQIRVRTYERGVGETKSCGSGGAAVYCIASALFGLTGKRSVLFSSGESVDYEYVGDELIMSGPVTALYKGIIEKEFYNEEPHRHSERD